MRIKRTCAVAFAGLAMLAIAACGSDDSGDNVATTSPLTRSSDADSGSTGAPASRAAGMAEVKLSPDQVCALLNASDMAPLTDGKITDQPTPTNTEGLPGCKWPVQNGYGWLAASALRPANVDVILSATSVRTFTLPDGGTVHQQFDKEGKTSCQALVRTEKMPKDLLLSVKVDTARADDSANLCEKAAPQISKVLSGFSW